MLKKLHIQNYALISELDMEFDKGLTIISGETGAGKSILLGALSLILGQRADTGVLNDKTVKCIVEGSFSIGKNEYREFFDTNNLDQDELTILRREINIAGKSRAFINDTPVSLNVLRELGIKLVDIHSQHHNILLADNRFQLKVVDAFAGNGKLLESYGKEYNRYRKLLTGYTGLRERNEKARSELDYFQFQYRQMEEAKLREGEQQELEEEQKILNHSGEIVASLNAVHQHLSSEGSGMLENLREIRKLFEKIREFYSPAAELYERFDSVEIELSDIDSELEMLASKVENDPSRLAFVDERLNLIYGLEQKHNADSVEHLIKIREELKESIEGISSSDEELLAMEAELAERKALLGKMAGELSGRRTDSLEGISERMINILQKLGIPNAAFSVKQARLEELSPTGVDRVDFLFSANKNTRLQDLKKVASGGELSRVMLSLKSLITAVPSGRQAGSYLPTIILDEIDSGVSGDIADRVGEIIYAMASDMQVINITHLPQIASKGLKHYLVYKSDDEHSTRTMIKLLSSEDRLMEIAKMLSGKEMSEAAVENARILLSSSKD